MRKCWYGLRVEAPQHCERPHGKSVLRAIESSALQVPDWIHLVCNIGILL